MRAVRIEQYDNSIILEAKSLTKLYKARSDGKVIKLILNNVLMKRDIGIQNISLTLSKGQVLGIVGDQKSGKSTLLKIICGLTEATSGDIYVEGKKNSKDDLKRLTTYISRDKIVYDDNYNSSVLESIIQFASQNYNDRNVLFDKVQKLLHDFDIENFMFSSLAAVPCKIRNLVFVIRGLVCDKMILCFDQPYKILGKEYIDQFDSYIKALSGSGKSIVITSCDIDNIKGICDEIMYIAL